jgi:hypothetical protein
MPTTPVLYKAAVRDLRGDELLPLNMIRERYPEVYEREIVKYSGRSHVMRHPVPPLDCTWSDVVFFSPVHLMLIFDAIRSSGRISSGPDYWTIDASLLSPDRTCILLKRHDPTFAPPAPADFLPYSSAAVAALSTPSPQALHRLRNLTRTEPLLPFADIPHILHRGPISITLLRTSAGTACGQG